MEEIKACPMCGKEGCLVPVGEAGACMWRCECGLLSRVFQDTPRAMNWWNTRKRRKTVKEDPFA